MRAKIYQVNDSGIQEVHVESEDKIEEALADETPHFLLEGEAIRASIQFLCSRVNELEQEIAKLKAK